MCIRDSQKADLVQIAEHAIDQLRPVAQNRELVFEHMLPEIELLCDPLRVQQMLANLIGNAIRYSPNHTRIEVRLSIEQRDWLTASHPAFADYCIQQRSPSLNATSEPFVLISVTDQGSGIPSAQVERLFRRYERGEAQSGEGLGLGPVSYTHLPLNKSQNSVSRSLQGKYVAEQSSHVNKPSLEI